MKLPYDELATKVEEAFYSCPNLKEWQRTLRQILLDAGWTEDEFEEEVWSRV